MLREARHMELDGARRQPEDVQSLRHELRAARAEIAKLQRQMSHLTRTVQRELAATRREALAAAGRAHGALVASSSSSSTGAAAADDELPTSPEGAAAAIHAPSGSLGFGVTPIGCLESCFTHRNGTPRQPGLVPSAAARLRVTWGTCPEHTLAGLEAFSHVWLLFLFDQNRGGLEVVKAKVKPPRLDGAVTGLFACRTPHRPNPIGLSLVRLERVDGDTLYLNGADLIDGTPVVDIKPYVPFADSPRADSGATRAPTWVMEGARDRLRVEVTEQARSELRALCGGEAPRDQPHQAGSAAGRATRAAPTTALRFYAGRPEAAEAALTEVLAADPRSVYRKQKCEGQGYCVTLDGLEASCRFERTPTALSAAEGIAAAAAGERDAGGEVAVVVSVRLASSARASSATDRSASGESA